ncbi:MAG: hypothetical protein ACXAB7_23335, partial [Candidatus Kariarchaeaceae archaeon]
NRYSVLADAASQKEFLKLRRGWLRLKDQQNAPSLWYCTAPLLIKLTLKMEKKCEQKKAIVHTLV